MRILMLVYNQIGKGTYWRAFHLARCLVARGHSVTLLATARTARWVWRQSVCDGVVVIQTADWLPGSLRSGWDIWNTLRRVAWLRTQSFDLVHAFEARPVVLLPALAAQRQGAKLIMDWCDWFGKGGSVEERANPVIRTILRPVETFFEENFRARAQGTTVINSVLASRAHELGIPDGEILLFRNGTSLHPDVAIDWSTAREHLGWSREAQVIVYTGALFRRDAGLMAAAFDRIHAARPSTRLLLLGYCNLPVERMVKAPDAVWRTGPVDPDTLAEHLAGSDLGWLPLCNTGANRGRFPMKFNDFLAVGLPVVATDVGDLGSLLRDEAIGYVAKDNPDDLARVTMALLDEPEVRKSQKQRALQLAQTCFAWPNIAAQVEAFYDRV